MSKKNKKKNKKQKLKRKNQRIPPDVRKAIANYVMTMTLGKVIMSLAKKDKL